MYIYSIRSPKHVARVRLDNGEVVTVAKYVYAYKPISTMFREEPRWQVLARARISRMANIWERFIKSGGKWPQCGVMVGDSNVISIGTYVMSWPYSGLPIEIEDCTCNNAKYIGKVAEILP